MENFKLVRNDFVNMDWIADNFIESKTQGFIGAICEYTTPDGDRAVGFQGRRAFLLVDEYGDIYSRKELIEAIKESAKNGYDVYTYYEDDFVELGNLIEMNEDMLDQYSFDDEDKADIKNRLDDLSCYWIYVEEEDVE